MTGEDRVPNRCPSCGGMLAVVALECVSCGTEVKGEYDLCPVCRLDEKSRKLFDLFLEARGNLKYVQRVLGTSYPTVRRRIEQMFGELGQKSPPRDILRILAKIRNGEITAEEAERMIRDEDGK